MYWIRADIESMVSIANANPVFIPGRLPLLTVMGKSKNSVLTRNKLFSSVKIMRIRLATIGIIPLPRPRGI
jgi:hypothetical protein